MMCEKSILEQGGNCLLSGSLLMSKKVVRLYACSLYNLHAAGTVECEIMVQNEARQCFILHYNDSIYAYVNRCPHTGINLNWQPNQFFDITGQLIQCSLHGALFRIEDGLCIRGPCLGDSLQAVNFEVRDNDIYLLYDQ